MSYTKLNWLEATPAEIRAWRSCHEGETLPDEPEIVRDWANDHVVRHGNSVLAEEINAERQSAIMAALAVLLRHVEG